MIRIQPRARRHILIARSFTGLVAIILVFSGRFLARVPVLSAGFANVTGPGAAKGVVVLTHGYPRDAGGVVVVGDGNVAGSSAADGLVDDAVADAAGAGVAAADFAGVAVALVEGVDVVDGAGLLKSAFLWMFGVAWRLTRLAPSSPSSSRPTVRVSVIRLLPKNGGWGWDMRKVELTLDPDMSANGVCFAGNIALDEPDESQGSSEKADGVEETHDGEVGIGSLV